MTTALYTEVIDMTDSSVFYQGFYDADTHSVWLVFNNGTTVNRFLPSDLDIHDVASWGEVWNSTLKNRTGLWFTEAPTEFAPREVEASEQETFLAGDEVPADEAEPTLVAGPYESDASGDGTNNRFIGVGFYVNNDVIEDLTLAWSELAYSVSDAASEFVADTLDTITGRSDVADTVLSAFRQRIGDRLNVRKGKN